MRAWRVCRAPYADLSGEGARLYGGRWNAPGRPMLYAAADAALAALEVRVHLDLAPDLIPDDYVLIEIDCGGLSSERVDVAPDDAQAFGDAWLAQRRTAALSVPSAIIPESRNILLNPAHPDASKARILSRRAFSFDRRLWLPL
jgi:RES domain-containing protein